MEDYYQIEFADFHQLLSIHRDLLHVNGDREHRVGATTHRHNNKETINKSGNYCLQLEVWSMV